MSFWGCRCCGLPAFNLKRADTSHAQVGTISNPGDSNNSTWTTIIGPFDSFALQSTWNFLSYGPEITHVVDAGDNEHVYVCGTHSSRDLTFPPRSFGFLAKVKVSNGATVWQKDINDFDSSGIFIFKPDYVAFDGDDFYIGGEGNIFDTESLKFHVVKYTVSPTTGLPESEWKFTSTVSPVRFSYGVQLIDMQFSTDSDSVVLCYGVYDDRTPDRTAGIESVSSTGTKNWFTNIPSPTCMLLNSGNLWVSHYPVAEGNARLPQSRNFYKLDLTNGLIISDEFVLTHINDSEIGNVYNGLPTAMIASDTHLFIFTSQPNKIEYYNCGFIYDFTDGFVSDLQLQTQDSLSGGYLHKVALDGLHDGGPSFVLPIELGLVVTPKKLSIDTTNNFLYLSAESYYENFDGLRVPTPARIETDLARTDFDTALRGDECMNQLFGFTDHYFGANNPYFYYDPSVTNTASGSPGNSRVLIDHASQALVTGGPPILFDLYQNTIPWPANSPPQT